MYQKMIGPADLRVCNCAQCGRLLLGETQYRESQMGQIVFTMEPPRVVEGRIQGRPYCHLCLDPGKAVDRPDNDRPKWDRMGSGRRVIKRYVFEDGHPGGDNAVRLMEDAASE